MATTFNSGGQSTSHQRPIERVLEDAQYTGEINLSGRKLREYPKLSTKYDLADTSVADLSKNRLAEVPTEICEYRSLDRLNCYHNVIKILPEALTQLQNLTHLCISRNQLTVIPSFIKQLHALEVLIASHNRIVSLPEEIGELKRLMEIDVSCNEISHLPVQIGDLKSLRSLNVRRNLLVELPLEISKLHLRKLDFASNKIAVIPTIFRKLETLEEFILDHNPLTLPPAFVCTKGKQHIMKYLQIEAIKEDRKRGILNDTEMKRLVRKSLPPQNSISSEEFRNMIDNTSPENKWKRHTVLSSDSGYSTTDSIEKCGVWSPSEASDMDDRITNKMANMVREPHQKPDPARRILDSRPPPINTACAEGIAVQQNNHLSPKTPTPGQYIDHIQYSDHTQYSEPNNHVTHLSSSSSPLSPQTPVTPKFFIDKSPNDDEFTRELQRQKSDYERKKKQAEQIRLQQEEEDKENRRLAAQRVQEAQQAEIAKQREELRLQEEARIREEERSKEEARRLEEERLREEARIAEEQRQKEDAKRQAESKTNGELHSTKSSVNSQHYHYQGWQTSERYSPGYTSSSHAPSNHFSPAASSTLSPTYGGHQVTSRGYPPSLHGYPPAHVSRSPASPFYSPDHENFTQNNSNYSRPYEANSPGYTPSQRGYPTGVSGHRPGQNGYISGSTSYSPGYSTGSGHSPGAYSPNSPGYSPVTNTPSGDPNQRLTNYHQEFQHSQNDRNMVDNYDPRYRNPVQSSQSFNSEDKKPSNSTQYRRTASDSVKKSTNVATSRSNQAKHTPSRSIPVLQRKTVSGTMNGKSPSSPGISPSPSPRSSVGSTGPSPASSTSSLHKTGVNTTSVVRRTKVTDRVATAPSSRTTPGSERHGRAATGSSTGAPSSARTPTTNSTSGPGRKNHLTPVSEKPIPAPRQNPANSKACTPNSLNIEIKSVKNDSLSEDFERLTPASTVSAKIKGFESRITGKRSPTSPQSEKGMCRKKSPETDSNNNKMISSKKMSTIISNSKGNDMKENTRKVEKSLHEKKEVVDSQNSAKSSKQQAESSRTPDGEGSKASTILSTSKKNVSTTVTTKRSSHSSVESLSQNAVKGKATPSKEKSMTESSQKAQKSTDCNMARSTSKQKLNVGAVEKTVTKESNSSKKQEEPSVKHNINLTKGKGNSKMGSKENILSPTLTKASVIKSDKSSSKPNTRTASTLGTRRSTSKQSLHSSSESLRGSSLRLSTVRSDTNIKNKTSTVSTIKNSTTTSTKQNLTLQNVKNEKRVTSTTKTDSQSKHAVNKSKENSICQNDLKKSLDNGNKTSKNSKESMSNYVSDVSRQTNLTDSKTAAVKNLTKTNILVSGKGAAVEKNQSERAKSSTSTNKGTTPTEEKKATKLNVQTTSAKSNVSKTNINQTKPTVPPKPIKPLISPKADDSKASTIKPSVPLKPTKTNDNLDKSKFKNPQSKISSDRFLLTLPLSRSVSQNDDLPSPMSPISRTSSRSSIDSLSSVITVISVNTSKNRKSQSKDVLRTKDVTPKEPTRKITDKSGVNKADLSDKAKTVLKQNGIIQKCGDISSPLLNGVISNTKIVHSTGSISNEKDVRLNPKERPAEGQSSTVIGNSLAGSTSVEEEYRQKHPGMRSGQPASNDRPPVGRLEDSRLKSTQKDTVNNFVTRKPALSEEERKRSLTSTARTTNYNNRRSGGVMSSSSTMKVIDSYKDSESNYTLRRQEEKLKEEADQLDRLRKTIESKLKVTLPDNLPETLRDGVLLCQLANSIRPRAVTSIHVPSPAVPKLTMAKCRKNVENFLEACRKIGVQRDHLCTCEDITDNLRLNRVANTVQQLALCPRLTPKDFHEQMCGAQDILEEKGISRVAVTIATLVSMQSGPRGSNV